MSDKLPEALKRILRPTNDAYFAAHEGWWDPVAPPDEWQPLIYKYTNLTMIGSVHSYQPDSPMINFIRDEVETFLKSSSTDDPKLVMVEGYSSGHIPTWPSLENAIQVSGESGMTAHLARQPGTKLISPEVESSMDSLRQLTHELLSKFTPETLVLYYLIESLGSIKRKNQLNREYVAGTIFRFSILYKPSFMPELSKEEIMSLANQKLSEDLIGHIWQTAIPELNSLSQNLIGTEIIKSNGESVVICISDELIDRVNDPTIFPDQAHPYASILNDIARVEDAARDNYLVKQIWQEHQ